MKTVELTLRLPEDEGRFLEAYARERAMSVAELLARYARRLRQRAPHPDNLKFTGSVPADLDARDEYRKHIEKKHQ